MINNLRRDLTSTKSQLNNYRCIEDYLIKRRHTLVEELSDVDHLLATLTFEEKQQRSVACTARQHNIEAECGQETRDPLPFAPSSQPNRSPIAPRSTHPPPHPSSPHPASSRRTLAETESTASGDTNNNNANDDSEAERQHSSQQGNQEVSRQRKLPRKNRRPAPRFTQPQQLPHLEVSSPRQQQDRCHQCRRHGHTQDQCPRKVCDYCNGRSHSSQNCRVRIADERQQELVQAVRQANQETLSALRNVSWQLQQPSSQRRMEHTLVPPQRPPVPSSPWHFTPHPLPYQYEAAPRYFPATLHAY